MFRCGAFRHESWYDAAFDVHYPNSEPALIPAGQDHFVQE
jgi:hypothetical protein